MIKLLSAMILSIVITPFSAFAGDPYIDGSYLGSYSLNVNSVDNTQEPPISATTMSSPAWLWNFDNHTVMINPGVLANKTQLHPPYTKYMPYTLQLPIQFYDNQDGTYTINYSFITTVGENTLLAEATSTFDIAPNKNGALDFKTVNDDPVSGIYKSDVKFDFSGTAKFIHTE